MKFSHSVSLLLASLLAGCVSHEGRYSPACVAFAGSNIELQSGQFVWEKFTDSVIVDDDGEIVNQFPGYPMQGRYRIDDQALLMESASGESVAIMYLHRQDHRQYLLTAEQHEAWESGSPFADCSLVLGGNSDQ